MDLFKEYSLFVKNQSVTLRIFRFLSLFDIPVDGNLYVETINTLMNKIKDNITLYNIKKSEELYNVIDNDFVTLNDLVTEFKNIVYPCFPVSSLAIISNFGVLDIDKMIKYKKNNEIIYAYKSLLFQIYKTLEYFPTSYQEQVRKFLNQEHISDKNLENIIYSIKSNKKVLKNEGLENSYIELITIYFNYLFEKGLKNV